MADATAITLHDASITSTGAFASAAVDIGAFRSAVDLTIWVTAIPSGGKFDLELQTSTDGSTGWRKVAKVPSFGAVGKVEIARDGCDRYVRLSGTLTSQPATLTATGEAHQLYVQRSDVKGQITSGALERVSDQIWAEKLIAVSETIEDALRNKHALPVEKVGRRMRQRGGDIVAWEIIRASGIQPDTHDEVLLNAAETAEKWFRDEIRTGKTLSQATKTQETTGPHYSTGAAATPETFQPRMSDDFADF